MWFSASTPTLPSWQLLFPHKMKATAGQIIFCTPQEHITCFCSSRDASEKCCVHNLFLLNIWQLFESITLILVMVTNMVPVCHMQHFLLAWVHFFVSYKCSKVMLLWTGVCVHNVNFYHRITSVINAWTMKNKVWWVVFSNEIKILKALTVKCSISFVLEVSQLFNTISDLLPYMYHRINSVLMSEAHHYTDHCIFNNAKRCYEKLLQHHYNYVL